MRAAVIRQTGPPAVLQLVQHPLPKAGKGELLLEVHATSVNPVDWKTRKGEVLPALLSRDKIPGGDIAGVVAEAKGSSSKFKVGDRVFALTSGYLFNNKWGTYAEYAPAKEADVAAMPEGLSFEEAAGLPLTGLTAWQALEAAGLRPGQRLLVHAGAGGVGSMAVQLAKARALHVTTTCGPRNIDFVTQTLGADEAVDYTRQRFWEVYAQRPFDGVIDMLGGDTELRSHQVLKPQGSYVAVANDGWVKKYGQLLGYSYITYRLLSRKLRSVLRLGPRYHLIFVQPNGSQLAQLAQLVQQGKLRAFVDRQFPLEQAAEAQEYSEQGHVRGKVIIKVK